MERPERPVPPVDGDSNVDSQNASIEEVLAELPDGGKAAADLARSLFRDLRDSPDVRGDASGTSSPQIQDPEI